MKKVGKILAAVLAAVQLFCVSFNAYAAIPYPKVTKEPGALHGWLQSGEYYWYYDADGNQVVNAFTDDGYYMDADGRWRKENIILMDESFETAGKYRSSNDYPSFVQGMLKDLDRLNSIIKNYLGSTRLIRMNDDAVCYYRRGTDNKETLLMGLYRDQPTGGWRLRLASNLGDRMGNMSQASTYDYLVFLFFLSRISHLPFTAADAIYGSWQGTNPAGIKEDAAVRVGDLKIRSVVVNGAADYYITDGRE